MEVGLDSSSSKQPAKKVDCYLAQYENNNSKRWDAKTILVGCTMARISVMSQISLLLAVNWSCHGQIKEESYLVESCCPFAL